MWAKCKLYLSFVKTCFRARMMHRGAFIAGMIGQWFLYGSSLITLFVMVDNFESMGGWRAEQVVFMHGFNLLSYGIAAMVFFKPCKQLSLKVHTGGLDASLTKPLNPLEHELYLLYNPGHIGHSVLGIVTMLLTGREAGFHLSLGTVSMFLIMQIGAILMQSGCLILVAVGGFWFVKYNPLWQFVNIGDSYLKYPITIFDGGIQVLITIILPFAFMNFYPVSAILQVENYTIFPAWISYLSPLVGVGLFVFSIWAWNKSLSRYQSTGS